jgi:succinate dehydrogenase flavin-adding protein (antitoxin of CptAB toxin-antitoxin module)
MRELDALLSGFAETHAAQLTGEEMACFEAILELPDPVLHAYLVGRSEPDSPAIASLLERIRASVVPQA